MRSPHPCILRVFLLLESSVNPFDSIDRSFNLRCVSPGKADHEGCLYNGVHAVDDELLVRDGYQTTIDGKVGEMKVKRKGRPNRVGAQQPRNWMVVCLMPQLQAFKRRPRYESTCVEGTTLVVIEIT
ncbi:hypothetical protein BDN72DRAFT_589078 [Pluteus cervinus]|uniref:Uncharacterized protein n=1 Tax=Pluteus cervinus TaxID=181527 RepID=A0ACD3A1X5_9AGAR|nr:hypothetical protein BDN72DRAFT_589078 [Pluteus cervinus]